MGAQASEGALDGAAMPVQLFGALRPRILLPMPGGTAVENAITAGFQTRIRIGRGDRQTQFQNLPHGCGSRRHPMFEPKIVQRRELIRGEHHLQSLAAEVVHGTHQIETVE